jgi:transposase
MEYVGIDVHKNQSQICLFTEAGEVLHQRMRFDHAHHVESYLGLVPREWSSGEQQQRGTITKQGSGQMRALLVGAAWRIWCRKGTVGGKLRQWAERLAARRGKRIAVVALARRLAGILYALWRDGSVYDETHVGQRRHCGAVTA